MINKLRTFLADPGAILDAAGSESYSGSEQSQLIERGRQIAEDLGTHAPDKVKAMLMALLCRVEIRSDRIDITLSRCRLIELLAGANNLKIEHHPWLAPDIIMAIINGRKPPQVSAQTLMRLTPRLPAGWSEQRKLLGFR